METQTHQTLLLSDIAVRLNMSQSTRAHAHTNKHNYTTSLEEVQRKLYTCKQESFYVT